MTKKEQWRDSFDKASEEVSQWRQTHRRARLSDIENAVDDRLAKVRAEMIEALIAESELTDLTAVEPDKRPTCSQCGQSLVSNGRQTRKLITNHEQVIEVERSKGYCRACGTSSFPPG